MLHCHKGRWVTLSLASFYPCVCLPISWVNEYFGRYFLYWRCYFSSMSVFSSRERYRSNESNDASVNLHVPKKEMLLEVLSQYVLQACLVQWLCLAFTTSSFVEMFALLTFFSTSLSWKFTSVLFVHNDTFCHLATLSKCLSHWWINSASCEPFAATTPSTSFSYTSGQFK